MFTFLIDAPCRLGGHARYAAADHGWRFRAMVGVRLTGDPHGLGVRAVEEVVADLRA